LEYARDAHVQFDEFAFAPYWGVSDAGMNGEVLKKVDVDQVCDMADMQIQQRDSEKMKLNADILAKNNFKGNLVCYEGGPCSVDFYSLKEPQATRISIAWANHPRTGPLLRCYLQHIQDAGVTMYTAFTLSQNPGRDMWTIYPYRWNQLDGKGDGSDGLFDNRKDLQSGQCVSVKGYWYHDWIDREAKKSVDGKE
jgi:hypothetical protein